MKKTKCNKGVDRRGEIRILNETAVSLLALALINVDENGGESLRMVEAEISVQEGEQV